MTAPAPTQYPAPVERVGSQLERTVDLQANLATFKQNRDAVMTFINDYLEEAEYEKDPKTGQPVRGKLVPGKLGDYYQVEGSEQRALTKRGASKVKQLFRWSRGAARHVAGEQTKDYCSATIEVPIVDHYGTTVGAGIGACSTAERSFTSLGAVKKYGGWGDFVKGKGVVVSRQPDYRAALHDVISKATKRADVQATIVAAALEEVFVPSTEDEGAAPPAAEQVQPAAPVHTDRPPTLVLPTGKFGKYGGKPIPDVPTDDLVKIADHLRTKVKDPAKAERLLASVDAELERRRLAAEDDLQGEDDLPF